MQELLDWLEYLEDGRQQSKVRHKLKDILVIVLFATLANVDDWVEIAMFADYYQDYFRFNEKICVEKDTGFAHIVSVKPPASLLKHSLVSPSTVCVGGASVPGKVAFP